jgi:hypothetical protein
VAPLRRAEWAVYSKRPFGGPEAVLAYLSRYTHRAAISNSRLISCDDTGVTFKWKDCRAEGCERRKIMTLATNEFIRRFLIPSETAPNFHPFQVNSLERVSEWQLVSLRDEILFWEKEDAGSNPATPST